MPSPVKTSPFVNTLETCRHKGSPGMFLNVFYGFIFPPATNIGNVRLASGLPFLLDLFLFPLSSVFTWCSVETSCMQTAPPCSPLEYWCLCSLGGFVVMNNSSRCSGLPVGRFQIIFYFKQTIQCYVSYNILSPALQWALFFLFITVNVKF